MQLEIEHLSDSVDSGLEEHAQKRLAKLERYWKQEDTHIRLVFADENSSHKGGIDKRVSLQLSPGGLFAEALAGTWSKALDESLDRLERQIVKRIQK